MPRAGFELWLARRYPGSPATVRARLSNIARLESAYGALETHHRRDRCRGVMAELAYSSADAARRVPGASRIRINGDLRNGLSTLRGALKLYVAYLDEAAGGASGLTPRRGARRAPQPELSLGALETWPRTRGARGKAAAATPAAAEAARAGADRAEAEPAEAAPAEAAPAETRRASAAPLAPHEVLALLARYGEIEATLRGAGVIRTANVLGDYAEWLCVRAFCWRLADNSARAFDATDDAGRRFQIKARRISARNPSRQLSAIRNLDGAGFDLLAGLLFRPDFRLLRAALVPRELVAAQAVHVGHVNAWRFMLSDAVFAARGVVDVTDRLRAAQTAP